MMTRGHWDQHEAQTGDRLTRLVEAGVAFSGELSLDALLLKLVEAGAELIGARYAALGVIDRAGRELERFVTTGVDEETKALIGPLPRGGGILGLVIREAAPLRLHDLTEDPRSAGFPPGHPPMRTFLGMPIVLRGTAYGNLYLTEKAHGEDFTEEDEQIAALLAAQAAVAIENARLYETATKWSRQLESLNEVTGALAGAMELPELLDLVAQRLRALIEARLVIVARPWGESSLRVEAADGERAGEALGTVLQIDRSRPGRAFERRQSLRTDSVLDDPDADQELARRLGMVSALYAPLVAGDRAIGVVVAINKVGADPRFSEEDLRLTEAFADRAAVAAERTEHVAQDALRRVIEAQEIERRRLALELHDQTGQTLTSVLLGLKAIEEDADEKTRAALARLREVVVTALEDVRQLALELRPRVLDDFGLVAAIERLTSTYSEHTRIAVDFETNLASERLPDAIETALYRIMQESLTNVAKHARASHVSVVLSKTTASVRLVIEDDGRGFTTEAGEQTEHGLGLVGMRERVRLVQGRLDIESRPGAGTSLVVEVPLS